ncbi:hypothetical protein LDELB18P1_0769 [Lactobacillus delbrueckii]|uniref:Uncharacterized protein n=1 Tax=Lactobacillus delbrueckii TaxID=1584 RepID=A0A4V2E177_9LACO|nr:hypothetical protein LDELB18P1_0769 [Lactobacillus delbrueckii]
MDHPHLRGEYLNQLHSPNSGKGSPPLAWGILIHAFRDLFNYRITPTCVGNTFFPKSHHSSEKDHPHLRGEYTTQSRSKPQTPGSPPLAWGIRTFQKRLGNEERITPTCVGNTKVFYQDNDVGKDHPHLRGEYLVRCLTMVETKGSPPLAWGILSFKSAFIFRERITPTCVGNTLHAYVLRL